METVKMNPVKNHHAEDMTGGDLSHEISWDYQGKSRKQLEGSYKIFSLCLLLFFIGLLMYVIR